METKNQNLPQKQEKPTITGIIAKLPDEVKSGVANVLELRQILNSPPPQAWQKKHPYGNYTYIPIDKVELLLDALFLNWELRVNSYSVIANSITVHVTLTVHTYDGLVRSVDGLGAAPIHTEKGASPVDHSKILTDSVMKALPAAKSFALKDAADHLGEIFGRNINRKDIINYSMVAPNLSVDEIKSKLEKK